MVIIKPSFRIMNMNHLSRIDVRVNHIEIKL